MTARNMRDPAPSSARVSVPSFSLLPFPDRAAIHDPDQTLVPAARPRFRHAHRDPGLDCLEAWANPGRGLSFAVRQGLSRFFLRWSAAVGVESADPAAFSAISAELGWAARKLLVADRRRTDPASVAKARKALEQAGLLIQVQVLTTTVRNRPHRI
ncbi:MAG: hypothetical protein F4103_15355 [Boseongicola sp. SB0673_bin_14]|nr:hypothetical protein [Boseongicola sp. SB0667_bin_21]MYI70047.1 hypothetical protein [Boseongicola sp. SB0673_bin_14]